MFAGVRPPAEGSDQSCPAHQPTYEISPVLPPVGWGGGILTYKMHCSPAIFAHKFRPSSMKRRAKSFNNIILDILSSQQKKTQAKNCISGVILFEIIYTTHTHTHTHTANEGPVRTQCKCLVPIYVLPEMKLLFPKQKCNVLFSSSYTHISVRDLFISRIGLPILLQENMWTDPRNI